MKYETSKYWIKKWQEKRWGDYRELTTGSIFDTAVKNHVQMANRVGDIIFWYRTDKNKKGIYFITKVVGQPKKDDAYKNSWSMSVQVIKSLVKNPFIPEVNGFNNLIKKIDAKFQGGATYNILASENPEKLWELLIGHEKVILNINTNIDKKDLKTIESIKNKNINDGKMFNPFLDMNLVKHEVKHLSFLTNLLNPNGTHFQGVSFLELFLKTILNYESQENNKYIQNFCNNENIFVQTEKVTPNGRIDIWIENDEYIIAIEGKTESTDSRGQLTKYDEYLKKQDKPYLLIYLTKYGEEPKNNYPINLQLMDFYEDISTFIYSALKIETLPKKIHETLNEYSNSLITYLNNFSDTWNYELDIIDEITKSKQTYLTYENIKNIYFYDTQRYKYSVVEDVANVFEKAKAKIERDFLFDIHERCSEILSQNGFELSEDSDLCLTDLPIDINYDIDIILDKRKYRTSSFENDNINIIKATTGINIPYVFNDYVINIFNDIEGLNIYISEFKHDEMIKQDSRYCLEPDVFNSVNIKELFNKEYRKRLIEKCFMELKKLIIYTK